MTDQRWQDALVWGLIALVFLGALAWVSFRAWTFANRAVSVRGTVTALRSYTQGIGRDDGFIVFFRFTTREGREIKARTAFAVKNPPAVGATAPVRYDPRKPERARIVGREYHATGLFVSLFISGAFGVLMSVLLLLGVI